MRAWISKCSHCPLILRAAVKALKHNPSHCFSLIFSRKHIFCERVNAEIGEKYVYRTPLAKPSPSIHHAFLKPSQTSAWVAVTTRHLGFFTRRAGETSPGFDGTSPGLEKTSPGLVRTTLGLVAGGSDGARQKRETCDKNEGNLR